MESSANEPTAKWTVPLSDGNHVVEFEHGTATGRRIVKVDGEQIVHRDWMFRLVGDEVFMFNNTKFVIRVDPMPGRISSFYASSINVLLFHHDNYLNRSEIFLLVVGEWKKLQTICSITNKDIRDLVS